MNTQELQSGLAHFYGTEEWHYNPLYPAMKYTDGVKFFAQNAGGGAYWFLDIVGTEVYAYTTKEEFISVKLSAKDGKATITADDGNGAIFWMRKLDYTDCPDGEWKFFLTDSVLMLPSEY